MCEKRFTVIDHNEWAEGDVIYYDDGEEMGWLDVCDKLNELNDKNIELKEKISRLDDLIIKEIVPVLKHVDGVVDLTTGETITVTNLVHKITIIAEIMG